MFITLYRRSEFYHNAHFTFALVQACGLKIIVTEMPDTNEVWFRSATDDDVNFITINKAKRIASVRIERELMYIGEHIKYPVERVEGFFKIKLL